MIEWNIQSRAHACQVCQRHFTDKESFHTLLCDHRHSYERLDVCGPCWAEKYAADVNARSGFVSHWSSVYTPPPTSRPDPIGRETAESLLRRLIEQNDPAHAGARFILAVMLERKRLLKVKAQIRKDGRRIFIYEQAKTGDLFNIVDPDLQLDQLEEVQRDVAHLLEHGLTWPAPATTAAAPPSSVPDSTPAEPSPKPEPVASPTS
ncbi:MAG: hypothetical protein EXS31_13405 [Pedosphaera sp.]|nr:hypothetical protein [Pedosphaera sp.]